MSHRTIPPSAPQNAPSPRSLTKPTATMLRWSLAVALATASSAGLAASELTKVEILTGANSNNFAINGTLTYAGTTAQGLLLNARMVNGIFDDENPATRPFWNAPDGTAWNPDTNTDAFIAAMPAWKASGLLAFTLNLQGGSPRGYSQGPWINSAFNTDGSLKTAYLARLERVLNKADEIGMVVILGLFYVKGANTFTGEPAILNACDAASDWLANKGYKNILIEIANESGDVFNYEILKPIRIGELIDRVQQRTKLKGNPLKVGTSFGGGVIPVASQALATDGLKRYAPRVIELSDFILLHGNSATKGTMSGNYTTMKNAFTALNLPAKPILVNEDDHFFFGETSNYFTDAVSSHVSWGYFDYSGKVYGDGADEGFQSVPANWKLQGSRKVAFFNAMASLTNKVGPGPNNTAPRIGPAPDEAPKITAFRFDCSDAETRAGNLALVIESSNSTLLPASRVTANWDNIADVRAFTFAPVAGQTGTAIITMKLSDQTFTSQYQVAVTTTTTATTIANLAPTVTSIINQNLTAGQASGRLYFKVSDTVTAASQLTVTRSSSNPTLIPTANLVLAGNDQNRNLIITPAAGQSGTAIITLSVSDGSLSSTTSFSVTVAAGTTPPPVTPPSTAVSYLTLFNTQTNQPVSGFENLANNGSYTFNVASLGIPAAKLSLGAFTSPGTSPGSVGSIKFDTYENSVLTATHTESTSPYALAGDTNGVYLDANWHLGHYRIVATPYSASGATGTVGQPLTIDFDVVSTVANTAPSVAIVQPAPVSITSGAALNASVNDDGKPSNMATTTWSMVSGPGTVVFTPITKTFASPTVVAGTTLVVQTQAMFSIAGSYVLRLTASDSLMSSSAEITVVVQAATSTQAVTNFTLIDAATDLPVVGYDPIKDGAVLPSPAGRTFSLRANTNPDPVGSVQFNVDTVPGRIESTKPYSLQGDTLRSGGLPPDYAPWTLLPGAHTIKGKPYTAAGATGTPGTEATVHFTIPAGG